MPRAEKTAPPNIHAKPMRATSIVCLVVLLSAAIAVAQASGPATNNAKAVRVEESVLHSVSLGRDMHYLILFPRDYAGDRRFPVLYLLHGLYGDYKNWDTKTRLERVAADHSILIVTPDADDSWYTNAATKPADRFEDYIVKDLISEIDKKYRTIATKRARAVAGLSMGGYAAVKFGLKYPELFGFSGSLSGAFNAAQNLDDLRPEFRAKLLEVFGNAGSKTRDENDVFLLVKSSQNYPYFYLACGTSDFFLDTNRALAARLSSQKLPYEYHETPGDHAWEYWDSELPPLLQAVERAVGSTAESR